MSIIFAAVLTDGVVLGADTLGHHHGTSDPVPGRKKVSCGSGPFAMAKAGYGPDADNLFQLISSQTDIETAFESLIVEGATTYAQCQQEAASQGKTDPGLYILLTGISSEKKLELYHLDFTDPAQFLSITKFCMVDAFGPDNARDVAISLFSEHKLVSIFNTGDVDGWVHALMNAFPQHIGKIVGYPVDVISIHIDGEITYRQIEPPPSK